MTLPDWTREPLVHFLAAGTLLYIGLTAFGSDRIDPADRTITVDATVQVGLAAQFESTLGRPPTDAELDAAIDAYVRDEVLYREALRLGLDQDDAVVRQRLVTKMDLSASAAAEIAEPDDATLRSFFEANAAQYSGEGLFTFEQAYFRDADAARAALSRQDAAPLGQPTSLPPVLNAATLSEVEARFGAQFAQGLTQMEPGEDWSDPVPSGFGWHLVRLTKRDRNLPDLQRVRARVLNDWRSQQINQRKDRAYKTLREAYRIEIEQ